ncbi:hypothetical protein LJC30_00585 [Odoribacter sp. OttesenSCG-928-L07]|nr:hypothetical protein [Odoribacter sp. OttesenSCG-928-L07]
MKHLLPLLIACTILLFGCNENSSRKYIGKYDFNIHHSYPVVEWNEELQHEIITWLDSTYSFDGSIKKSGTSNKIIVHWGEDTLTIYNNTVFTQTSEFTVDIDGTLTYPEYGGSGHTNLYPPAYISNDTIVFTICAGGLGMYSCWSVLGVKQ